MTYYYSKTTDRPFEETVARTRDALKAEGFGIITEINVTAPTGIRAIRRLGGPDIAATVWEAIEAKRR